MSMSNVQDTAAGWDIDYRLLDPGAMFAHAHRLHKASHVWNLPDDPVKLNLWRADAETSPAAEEHTEKDKLGLSWWYTKRDSIN